MSSESLLLLLAAAVAGYHLLRPRMDAMAQSLRNAELVTARVFLAELCRNGQINRIVLERTGKDAANAAFQISGPFGEFTRMWKNGVAFDRVPGPLPQELAAILVVLSTPRMTANVIADARFVRLIREDAGGLFNLESGDTWLLYERA